MSHESKFDKAEVEATAQRTVSRNRNDIAVAAHSAKENGRWMRQCNFPDRGKFWDLVAERITQAQ